MTKNGRNGTPTEKERLWAAHFVTDPARNATEAARQAGYAHPKIEGHRLRGRPRVKAMVAHLEAEARKRVRVKEKPPPKRVQVEVLPPLKPGQHHVSRGVSLARLEEHAVATQAEALGVATNIIRTHESRKLGDVMTKSGGTLVANTEALAEFPLTAIKGWKHDHAGDLELKLADPLAAARLILEDARRAREGEGAGDLASALIEVLRGAIEARAQERLPEGG